MTQISVKGSSCCVSFNKICIIYLDFPPHNGVNRMDGKQSTFSRSLVFWSFKSAKFLVTSSRLLLLFYLCLLYFQIPVHSFHFCSIFVVFLWILVLVNVSFTSPKRKSFGLLSVWTKTCIFYFLVISFYLFGSKHLKILVCICKDVLGLIIKLGD